MVVGNSLTRSVVRRFVAGESPAEGIRAAGRLAAHGIGAVLDYLGENVSSQAQADAAADVYVRTLEEIGRQGVDAHISVKLSQLGLDASFEGALDRMARICTKASEVGTLVAIDMESHTYTERTIECYRRLLPSAPHLVLCLQGYLRRTRHDVASLVALAPSIRLVKGAYNEPKQIAFGPEETRRSFHDILGMLIGTAPYVAVGTHDEVLIGHAIRLARERAVPSNGLEVQMLYGVRRELQARLVEDGCSVRAYIPFGDQWYPYLVRRLAERPANLRFFLEALLRK